MKLYDYHWINKGCTVEVLYGEHRSFNGVAKHFQVVGIDTSIPQDTQGRNTIIVNVYGDHKRFIDSSLKLIDKPGYVRLSEGQWVKDNGFCECEQLQPIKEHQCPDTKDQCNCYANCYNKCKKGE